jgi:hypothetical protein
MLLDGDYEYQVSSFGGIHENPEGIQNPAYRFFNSTGDGERLVADFPCAAS